jgi:hypothetical protein
LASKVTMTSEVEHIVAGLPWPSDEGAATAAGALAMADSAAAAAASASASTAALAAAQAKIEELLDDKADLEYEIDVVERKVELLREEVSSDTMGPWDCCWGGHWCLERFAVQVDLCMLRGCTSGESTGVMVIVGRLVCLHVPGPWTLSNGMLLC